MKIFSTITSPVFSELVLTAWYDEIGHLPTAFVLFKKLSEMYEIRPFKLVFLLEVPYAYEGNAQQVLMGVLDSVAEKGFLDFLPHRPTSVSSSPAKSSWECFPPAPVGSRSRISYPATKTLTQSRNTYLL